MKSPNIPPTYLLAAVVLIVPCRFVVPTLNHIAFPYNLAGLVLIAAGCLLNVLASKAFRYEERKMEAELGDAYREYCRKVRRWL